MIKIGQQYIRRKFIKRCRVYRSMMPVISSFVFMIFVFLQEYRLQHIIPVLKASRKNGILQNKKNDPIKPAPFP